MQSRDARCSGIEAIYSARRMRATEMRHGFSVMVVVAICIAYASRGEAERPSQQLQLQFTKREQASLDKLFGQIKLASRRGYETGDWSVLAKLYPQGALTCWNASGEAHHFSFLSIEGIPETARYTIGSLEDYAFGGVDTSTMNGTHFMSIRYETRFASGCDLPTPKKWPEQHFYLRKTGEEFVLVHPCPVKEQVEQKRIVEVWPMVSGADAARIVAAMTDEERQSIRAQVRKDAFPLNAIYSIQDRHKLSYEQASLVLDRVCAANPERGGD
jgi:hypothetical protein